MFIELALIIRSEAPLGAQYHAAHFAPNGPDQKIKDAGTIDISRLRRLRTSVRAA
jgi:hypothetical protein